VKIFISTDTIGGVWDYTTTLARELRGHGHEVMLAAFGEPSAGQMAQLPDRIKLEVRSYRLEWMPDAWVDVQAGGEWLAELSSEWGADVVHLNQLAYAVHDFAAPTVLVVHSDVLSWIREVRGCDPPAQWHEYAEMSRRGIAAADVLIAPTHYQSLLTEKHYGRAAEHVIYNGVRPPVPYPSMRACPLLLSVGRAWDEAKGMKVLDEAVVRLGENAPPAHVLGAERGPHGERFSAQRLVCHGQVGRMGVDRWMGVATAYVGASLYEPFGLAPLEAALQGCALILSDIGSFREIWDDAAVFFQKGDPEDLAEQIRSVHAESHRWRTLGEAAKARALQFTADRFGDAYLEIYENLRH
jgi:glycogen synthase